MKFKILLVPSWEKLPSFKVLACWSSESFTGLEVENTPPPPPLGAYKVNPIYTRRGQNAKYLKNGLSDLQQTLTFKTI